ncbi:MAG: hypothetical protein BMS9Abin05_0131 [Rhodothermia bacterium]|nr:MAG: hypothetical protein BMS9Abin05_0131 [Rhodothermia bacterium]
MVSAMFISDTFFTIVIVLLGVLASLYYFAVYRDVFADFFRAKPDHDDRTSELLSSYMAEKGVVGDQKVVERKQNGL